jgi:hypothetical protein
MKAKTANNLHFIQGQREGDKGTQGIKDKKKCGLKI